MYNRKSIKDKIQDDNLRYDSNIKKDCIVSKASTEIMLFRVFDGKTIDFPFSN